MAISLSPPQTVSRCALCYSFYLLPPHNYVVSLPLKILQVKVGKYCEIIVKKRSLEEDKRKSNMIIVIPAYQVTNRSFFRI